MVRRNSDLLVAALGTAPFIILNFIDGCGGNARELVTWLPLRCPLRWITGWQCPTCGLGRSLVHAYTFRYEESLRFHPLGVAAAFGIIVVPLLLFAVPKFREGIGRIFQYRALLYGLAIAYTTWGWLR